MGIDGELFDAARVDGANKLKTIWHITIPGIMPTYVVMFLLGVSNIPVSYTHLEAARYYNVIKNFLDNGSDKGADSLGWNYYKFIGPEGSWNTIINDYKANDKLIQSVFFGAPTPTMSTNLSSMDKMQAETYVNIIKMCIRDRL